MGFIYCFTFIRFFKHMSEVHQALFCRCCREYLPIHEQEEHRRWHAEPPYMGQKIRIESGQPVIIDRKERASLTPIGSLAPWGGSSGGMVVKAVDTGPPRSATTRKRKATSASAAATAAAAASAAIVTASLTSAEPSPDSTPKRSSNGGAGTSSPTTQLIGHIDFESHKDGGTSAIASNTSANGNKETLMPKETCPVCGILITYKNLARHIKLRHKIKYKFCHKCRQLVPNNTFEDHKDGCEGAGELSLEGEPVTSEDIGNDDEHIDPTEFLETNSNSAQEGEEGDDKLGSDARKSEEFRAATSKNKLHSLLGKEFKHPRRRCAICNYTVSYSNFKRHLRNAHPQQYQQESNRDFSKTIDTLSHAIDPDDAAYMIGHPMDVESGDDDDDDDDEELVIHEDDSAAAASGGDDGGGGSFEECRVCGDHIMADFLERHMAMNHPAEQEGEGEEEAEEKGKEGSESKEKEANTKKETNGDSPKAEEKTLEEMMPVSKNKKAIADEILND
jgi:hypothetical protein